MHSTMMMKQILEFNKKAFDDSFNAIVNVQEHAEKMMRVFWEKSDFFPEEGKGVFGDWIHTYKNGLDDFKQSVDSRFKLVEEYLLNAADQMQSSINTVVQQTEPSTTSDDKLTKVAADINKAASRKPALKKERISRKKTDK